MGKEENLLIVHLSDLHCGPKLQKKMLQKAIDEVNALSPDVVAVTGDLTEEGLFEEFQEARRYLQLLKCKHLVVVSGNHDARTTGYRLFPDFFGDSSSAIEVKDKVIIKLDSSKPDRDDGEVGYHQRLWLKECLDKYVDKFKIVMLHHHLLPVPDTGMEKNMVTDAGDVLWSLVSHKADAVLCGHRHRPWIWSTGDLKIIYAGTLSTNRLRGFYHNSYNIIRVEDKRLSAKLKIVGEEECDLDPFCIKTFKSSGDPFDTCLKFTLQHESASSCRSWNRSVFCQRSSTPKREARALFLDSVLKSVRILKNCYIPSKSLS